MTPRLGPALLQCLLAVLVALGPWTLVSGHSGDADCCGISLEMHASAGKARCDDHQDQKPPATCSHGCPAAHCSSVSFLPSASAFTSAPFLPTGITSADGIFTSHLAAPDTRPPIVFV